MTSDPSEPLLDFFWYEEPTNPDELRDFYWGELAGSIHSLHIAVEDLRALARRRKLLDALEDFAYRVENYLARMYELRERLVAFMGSVTGEPRLAGKLRKDSDRAATAERLAPLAPKSIPIAVEALGLMDKDLHHRNRHTHEAFAHLGLIVNGQMYDPADAVALFEGSAEERRHFNRAMRRMMREKAEEYAARAKRVWGLVAQILKQEDRRRRSQTRTLPPPN